MKVKNWTNRFKDVLKIAVLCAAGVLCLSMNTLKVQAQTKEIIGDVNADDLEIGDVISQNTNIIWSGNDRNCYDILMNITNNASSFIQPSAQYDGIKSYYESYSTNPDFECYEPECNAFEVIEFFNAGTGVTLKGIKYDIYVPDKTPAKTSHNHNFQWVTVTEPTVESDGLEQLMCSCGIVKESQTVIPATMYYVKTLSGEIKDAPENGSVTFDSKKIYCITDYMIKKLSERADVSITIKFIYEGKNYEFTIPAGSDFTELLSDSDTSYGYFGFCQKLGITVEEK